MRFGDLTVSPWVMPLVLAISVAIWGLGWVYQRYRIARYLLPSIPLSIGVWIGLQALAVPNGYIAAYFFAGAWMLAALVFLASVFLCFCRFSRQSGVAGLIASCMILASFYLTYGIGRGIAGPQKVERVVVGPQVKADVVVLFKSGTDPWKLESFDEMFLHEPHSALLVWVDDHLGYAITLSSSIQATEKAALMQRIASSPLVQAVFENVAPNEITSESISSLPNAGAPAGVLRRMP